MALFFFFKKKKDLFREHIIKKYEKIIDKSESPILPYLFSLNNEVKKDSNFFIFQKMVEGPFQVSNLK
jgi:hypothetical protein